MNWSWTSFFEYLVSPYMLAGAWTTIWLTCAAMAIGVVLGTVAAMMRLSHSRLLRWVAGFYVWLWRGTPLLVQLVIIYTGLPQFGIRLDVIPSALIGLGFNEGAYFARSCVPASCRSAPARPTRRGRSASATGPRCAT